MCERSLRFQAFGTIVSLAYWVPASSGRDDEALFSRISSDVSELCLRYERLLSRFIPDSDVSRVNAAAGEEAPVAVDSATAEVIRLSLEYCRRSQGLFDVTAGALTRLWKRGTVPSADDLAEAATRVDWRRVELGCDENGASTVRLAESGASLDLGGIAKGWIADKVGELLRAAGVANFALSLGGNVLAAGCRPAGGPWRVGVRNPESAVVTASVASFDGGPGSADVPEILDVLELSDAAAVTSGTYERCFDCGGKTYHHILDLQTGFPVETDLASATVVARRALDAEGFSTTLLALGSKAALEFAARTPEICQVVLVTGDGQVLRG